MYNLLAIIMQLQVLLKQLQAAEAQLTAIEQQQEMQSSTAPLPVTFNVPQVDMGTIELQSVQTPSTTPDVATSTDDGSVTIDGVTYYPQGHMTALQVWQFRNARK